MELTPEERQALYEVYRIILEDSVTEEDDAEEEETPQPVREAT
jgi:hypothetical protein